MVQCAGTRRAFAQRVNEERTTKLSMIALFMTLVGIALARPESSIARLRPVEWLQLGIAAHRIGRSIAFERVGTPIREPFTDTKPDSTGAGETVVARGVGARAAVGELLSCPTCTATWAAGLLAAVLAFSPRLGRTLITVFSAAGIAHLLEGVVEWLTWAGRADRTQVGRHDV
jgi:hypothetical protein